MPQPKLSKVKVIVEIALANFPQTRNSDELLQYTIWRVLQGLDLNDYESCKARKINAESIRRCRQIIQNKEMRYRPTDLEIMRQRGMLKTVYSNFAVSA